MYCYWFYSFLYDLSGSDKFYKFKWMVPHEIDIFGKVSLLHGVCVWEWVVERRKKMSEGGLQDKDNRYFSCSMY